MRMVSGMCTLDSLFVITFGVGRGAMLTYQKNYNGDIYGGIKFTICITWCWV